MREILFKAKRLDNGEWVEGWLFLTKDNTYIAYASQFDDDLFLSPQNIFIAVDIETICQYTGLTDKNGNKIWENDVVKKDFYTDYDACANSEEYTGVVKFIDCAWVIDTVRGKYICTRPIFESMAYSEDVKHFEVIGNIFDNKELLGE